MEQRGLPPQCHKSYGITLGPFVHSSAAVAGCSPQELGTKSETWQAFPIDSPSLSQPRQAVSSLPFLVKMRTGGGGLRGRGGGGGENIGSVGLVVCYQYLKMST